jgi:hypothetical protein
MNFRGTYILIGSLGVLFLGLIILSFVNQGSTSEGIFRNIKVKDIDSLTIVRGGSEPQTIVFERNPDTKRWSMTEPFKARVDSAIIDGVVREIGEARPEKNAEVSKNLSVYGLNDPEVKIILRGAGKEYTVNVGQVAALGSDFRSLVYITTSESPRTPIAVQRSVFMELLRPDAKDKERTADKFKSATAFRSLQLFEGGLSLPNDATKLVIAAQDEKGATEEMALKREGTRWKFEKPADFGYADTKGDLNAPITDLGPTGVDPVLKGLGELKIASLDDYVDSPSDAVKASLEPGKAKLRVSVTSQVRIGGIGELNPEEGKSQTETLLVGDRVDEKSDKVYARMDGDPTVFKLLAAPLESLRRAAKRPDLMRDRQLVPVLSSQVDALDIVIGKSKFELRRTQNIPGVPWQLFDGNAAERVSTTVVDELLTQLTADRAIKQFTSGPKSDAEMGFDNPPAQVTVWANAIVKEEDKKDDKQDEKKDDKQAKDKQKDQAKTTTPPKLKGEPVAKLTFGKPDFEYVYVRKESGKEKVDALVLRKVLELATRDRINYIDPVLPSFEVSSVAKLSFTRQGRLYELERQKTADGAPMEGWKILQPSELAGRKADNPKVNSILTQLSTLKAVRLISEKPDNQYLERWGLAPTGVVRATVTFLDATKNGEPKVYDFGKDSEQIGTVYARVNERNIVFTVGKNVPDSITTGEIQDLQVVSLDPAKVRSFKITGWGNLIDGGTKLEVEKVDGAWKSKVSYDLDRGKIDSFLSMLAGLRAEKIVDRSGAKAEYGFNPKLGSMDIEVVLSDQKDPVKLTVGGLDAEKRNFLVINPQYPQDVYAVAKDRFEAIRNSAVYFRRD